MTSDTSNSVAFAFMHDNATQDYIARWTGKQYTKLLSALFTGAHLMFPDEAGEIIWQLIKVVHQPIPFSASGCVTHAPSDSIVTFTPQNPYTEPDLVPEDYLVPPFFVNDEEVYPTLGGYLLTDVFIDGAAITLDPIDLLTLNLPTVKISVVGSGRINLQLLAVPAGSFVVMKVGSPPNIFDVIVDLILTDVVVIDLNVDALSIPPETDIVYTEEIQVIAEETETTDIYLVFVPAVDDSITPLRYGGGIRLIELCGFVEMPSMSCEDIEDCLEESVVINEIITNVTNVTNEVTNINTTIEDIEDCGCGGNVYPDEPVDYNQPSPINPEISGICNAAYQIANGLRDNLYTIVTGGTPPTYIEWLNTLLGATGYVAELLRLFWSYVIGQPEIEDLENALNDTFEEIAEIFFCNLLDRELVRAAIEASTMAEIAKDYWLASLDATSDALLNKWAFLGAETGENTCFHMCNWTVVWDFDGTYVPDGNEDAIFSGDTWEVVNGEFVDGIGYRGLADSWYITHPLPPDCAVVSMVHNVNKNEPCSAVDIATTWRGTSGTGTVEISPDARVLSDTPVSQNWTVYSAVLDHMTVLHNHFFCGGDNYGSQTHWLKMTGTGSRPSQ